MIKLEIKQLPTEKRPYKMWLDEKALLLAKK
jgi:hypothetical protein